MFKLEGMPTPNVINLRECEDRRAYTQEQFAKLGVADVRFHLYDRWPNSNIKMIGDPALLDLATKGVTSSQFLTIKAWLEETDEECGIFFEDDVDFQTVQHWNFTFKEFVDRCGDKWGALHLCNVFEYPFYRDQQYPSMIPRKREQWDHGLQCYMLKRWYAEKLVKYYFDQDEDSTIHYRMPSGMRCSTENNILGPFGRTFTFPLFNHNVYDFLSKNKYSYDAQGKSAIYSYQFLKAWWEKEGSQLSLEEIFNEERVKGEIYEGITL